MSSLLLLHTEHNHSLFGKWLCNVLQDSQALVGQYLFSREQYCPAYLVSTGTLSALLSKDATSSAAPMLKKFLFFFIFKLVLQVLKDMGGCFARSFRCVQSKYYPDQEKSQPMLADTFSEKVSVEFFLVVDF